MDRRPSDHGQRRERNVEGVPGRRSTIRSIERSLERRLSVTGAPEASFFAEGLVIPEVARPNHPSLPATAEQVEPTVTNEKVVHGEDENIQQAAASEDNIARRPISTDLNSIDGLMAPIAPTTSTAEQTPKSKPSKKEVIKTGLKKAFSFVTTFKGFLLTLYGLNIVAWGGMDFLLICNASPRMCDPTCDDINSPRMKWIEIDSEILVALLCIMGFGLSPWRFRDFFYLMRFRLCHDYDALRKLAEFHKKWFVLCNDNQFEFEDRQPSLNSRQANSRSPPPTKRWKLDFVVTAMALNTIFQAVLASFMWHYNRFNRPGWSTATFISLAFSCVICGGLMIFFEGRKVKKFKKTLLRVKESASAESSRWDLEQGVEPKREESND